MLLLITAMVGGGVEIRPAPVGNCSIATDDHHPDPQPREESADESAGDEEGEFAKHAAVGASISLDWQAGLGQKLGDSFVRFAPGSRLGAVPIRGPPSQA